MWGSPPRFTPDPPAIAWWRIRGEKSAIFPGHNTTREYSCPVRHDRHSRSWRTGPTTANLAVGPPQNRGLHDLKVMKSAAFRIRWAGGWC